MNISADALPHLHFPDRAAWRAWLEAHHAEAKGVWLVSFRKIAGQPGVSYDEAVEEALCFGWIDGRRTSIDDGRFRQHYSPRKPGSQWAAPNKERVARLAEAGLLAPAGQAVIEAARTSGAWELYAEVEALVVPPDLLTALKARPPALAHWEAFSPSARKHILWWIKSARREETRAKRVAATADEAALNRKMLSTGARKQPEA